MPPPPSDLPDPSSRSTPPPRRSSDEDASGDRHTNVAGLMVGTALMFIGFLTIFLSISSGFEIDVMPFLLYFGGLAVWANATIDNPTLRYSLTAIAIVAALAFFHYGEVLFWHKQLVFWATVAMVVYFMFRGAVIDRRD